MTPEAELVLAKEVIEAVRYVQCACPMGTGLPHYAECINLEEAIARWDARDREKS